MTTVLPSTPTTAPPPRPARTGPTGAGRVLTGVGIAVAVLLVLQLSAQLLSRVVADRVDASATYAATDVLELVVEGDLAVVVEDVDRVRVDRSAEYAWPEPRYTVETVGDRTVVRHTCVAMPLHCRVSTRVVVPEGTDVVVRAVDGTVDVAGPAGDVELQTSDGPVHVAGIEGSLDVRTVDGSVLVTDVGGDVRASATDASLEVSRVAGDVDVRGGDGRVDVHDVRGAVTAERHDGDVVVGAVRGDVTVSTVDGDITVHGSGEPVALSVQAVDGRQRVEAPTDPAARVRVDLRTVDGDVAYLGPRG